MRKVPYFFILFPNTIVHMSKIRNMTVVAILMMDVLGEAQLNTAEVAVKKGQKGQKVAFMGDVLRMGHSGAVG